MPLSRSALDAYLHAHAGVDAEREPAAFQGDVAPLTSGQEQIWLHMQAAPGAPLYNETVTLGYGGDFNLPAFVQSLRTLVERHRVLRTAIVETDGAPHQVLQPPRTVPCRFLDLSGLAPELREHKAACLARASGVLPFDLTQAPLLRVLAVRLSPADTRIFLALHHLIFDGASLRSIFLPELWALYKAYSRGEAPVLPPVGVRRRTASLPRESESLAFWRTHLAGLPALQLPFDGARPAQPSTAGDAVHFQFPPALTASLHQLASHHNATLFHVLIAGLGALLARCSGETDIPLATTSADPAMEHVLGCFLNTLVLRLDVSGNPSFVELVARASDTVVSALNHAEMPFQRVVREAGLSGRQPAVMVAMQPPQPSIPPSWSLDTFQIANGTAKFDLHIELEETSGGLAIRAQFRADLFERATVERLLGHWSTLLHGAMADPERSIHDLPLLRREELDELIHAPNHTARPYPPQPVTALFAQQAALRPDRIAVRFRRSPDSAEETLTYRELDRRSTAVAHLLRDRGAGPGGRVAVLLERSPELLIALLGVLKSGAAYLPLDPTYPGPRLESMLRAADALVLLTRPHLLTRVPGPHPHVLDMARIPLRAGDLPVPAPKSPAYLLFTSGSTGEPKGVLIGHRALTNLLWSMRGEPGLAAHDILLALTSISFDIAALELFLPLIVGACIELATAEEAADPLLLGERLKSSGATAMQGTPATWRMLLESGWAGAPGLKALCGGEALTESLAKDLLPRVGSLWNLYGPTETTIWSSCGMVGEGPVSLGKPIANTDLHVLDERGSLLPANCPGELAIGGDGLALGYWNLPEETARRFTVVGRDFDPPRRVYRTGDRVLRRPDGTLVFLGRTDRQVKLRGFRIELGEVEQAIRAFPPAGDAAVLKIDGGEGMRDFLAAYAVPRPGVSLDTDELRRFLEQRLPAYMRPSVITPLARLPLTLNGKVDRKQLPVPVLQASAPESTPPRTRVEGQLAALWSEILGVPQVGRDDDFFDLGGHSLLAARLLARVTALFGRRLPLAALVEAPTVAQLAVLLETGAPASGVASLRRGNHPGKHLVWLGGAPWLRELGKLLGEDHSLSSIVFSPETLAALPSGFRLEELARRMAARVRELQPQGPYLLGGFCLEGLLAYEVVGQMRAAGDEVALLVMGDVVAPGSARKSWGWHIERRVRQELPFLCRLARTPPWKAGPLLRWRKDAFHDNEERTWRRWGRVGSAPPSPPETMLQALYMAEEHYRPQPCDCPVLFLQAAGGVSEPPWHTASTWTGLLTDPEVFTYPGDHLDFMEEPVLSLGGARLREAIDRAAANTRQGNSYPRRAASDLCGSFSVQPNLESGQPIPQP